MTGRAVGNRILRLRRQILRGSLAVWLGLSCGAGLAAAAAAEAEPDPGAAAGDGGARVNRFGQWIRVTLPIDDKTFTSVQRTVRRALANAQDARPVFIFEFDVPSGAAEGGQGTQFEDALKLAKFLTSNELNAATTVAYIPKPIKGHAVLAALACEQIIMAEDATIGEASIGEKPIDDPEDPIISGYRTIAKRRHTVPVEVALGMLDKRREVLRVQTVAGTEFTTPAGLKDIRQKRQVLKDETIKPAGQPWNITGAEGRNWGFVKYLAADRRDVTRAMELPPQVIGGDPSANGEWRAVRVRLSGITGHENVTQVERLIGDKIRDGANFICLEIDSPGGSPTDSVQLANYLAGLDSNQVRTVAYVPRQARADAALIAMACDQVILLPEAVLGGSGEYQMTQEEIAANRQAIRDSLARQKLRPWSLWAAMIDPQLEVYRCTRLGDVEYFCDDELNAEQPKKGEKGRLWQKGELVTVPGRPLKVNGEKAVDYRLANRTVENFAQFKEYYGLENDPALVEPGWADVLIDALKTDGVAILLLFIGGAALYIELHTPGLGIGGFVATVCFALFFWSRYLNGTAGWLQVILFVTGIIFILLEIFVLPGFGIFGLGGGALVLLALVLASQTFFIPKNDYQLAQMQKSLLTVAAAVGGLVVTAIILRRWLPRAPVLQNVFLPPPEGEEAVTISRREMLVDLDNLLGATGVTTTPLMPGGKARFGNHLVDVAADGEFVTRDTRVVVVEVHGSRVVVRPVE
jgi:membrane-bound serine protease (ClpP class)